MAPRASPDRRLNILNGDCLPSLSANGIIWTILVLATVGSLGYLIQATPHFKNVNAKESSLEHWLEVQDNISAHNILANLGNAGAKAYGAYEGVLLDTPLPNPNEHLWTRVRDSNLVFKALVDRFIASGNQQLQLAIHSFISAQAKVQTACSPSGTLENGTGLAESRFLPNLTADPESQQGHPKPDGPALRATTLIAYGRWLLDNGHNDTARDIVWPIVRNDLAYTAQFWPQGGLDFWSSFQMNKLTDSFFATAAQHRALVEGSAFAKAVGQACPDCESQAPHVLCFLQEYWSPKGSGSVLVNVVLPGRTDTSTILSSIHTFDPEAGCNGETFQPCSERMLSNHKHVVDRFREWEMNAGVAADKAVALGRFSGEYEEGTAWYVSTLAAAEQLYDALYAYDKFRSINITSLSLGFWRAIYNGTEPGVWAADSGMYKTLYNAMRNYADGFVAIVQRKLPADGAMSQVFRKLDGKPTGARDFSWSYGAFLSMKARREGKAPASWGALRAAKIYIPESCSAESPVKGTYSPANNTRWPKFPCKPVSEVQLTFNLLAPGTKEKDIYVTGSIPELGNWGQGKLLPMDNSRYNEEKGLPLWSVSVKVPVGAGFAYKYGTTNWGGVESNEFRYQGEKETCWYAAAVMDRWSVPGLERLR